MSILYREPSIDASYQVSVHLAQGFQRRRLKCEKLTDDGRQVMAKAHIAFTLVCLSVKLDSLLCSFTFISVVCKLVLLRNTTQNIAIETKIAKIMIGPCHAMVSVVVFNATFNNISVIMWQSVLLVEETGVPEENHRPVASVITY